MDRYALDGHKLFWHLDRLIEWQKRRVITPIYVEISPVSFCNHKCIFCGLDFAHNIPYRLDADILARRLEEMGRAGVKSIMFAGEGEPLLHNDLPFMVKKAYECGLDVSITTNGSCGTEELWHEILPYLTWVRFSIDAATHSTYSKIHGVRESLFDKTIRSIETAIKVRSEKDLSVSIGIQFLLIRENLTDVDKALRLYPSLKVGYLSFKPYSEHPQMLNKMSLHYTDKILEEVDVLISKYKDTTSTEIIFRKESLSSLITGSNKYKHCFALPFWGYISSKGDFYTCSIFLNDDRFKVGNIYQENMESIIFGKKRGCSVEFGEKELVVNDECRVNCRMARVNEFLDYLDHEPRHINFV